MKCKCLRPWVAAVAILGASTAGQAQNDGRKFGELLRRIPEQANMLMLVDVDGLFESPLGQREQWRQKATEQARGDLGLPPTMARIAVAAGADLEDLALEWRIGMAEYRDRLPDLATLAAREGGFVEQINLSKVAWTPRDLYLVTFEPKVIGFVTPIDRQRMSKWITATFVKPRTFPPGYADHAVNRAEAGAQVVLAINLADSASAPLIKPWVTGLDGMQANTIDPSLLADRFASVKSAFLQIDVKESIEGSIRVEFDRPMDYAKPVAKAAVLSALAEAGVELDDLKTWRGGVDGKAIVLDGRLSEDSLRRILSFVHPPRLTPERPTLAAIPPGADASNEPTRQPAPSRESTQADVVKASQGYFRAVADILTSLKSQKSSGYHGMKTWYERSARQIDELPILGVDKALLDWGSTVSRTLREMAYGINYNVQDRKYTQASSNGYYGGYYGNPNAGQQTLRQQGEATLSVGLDGKWQLLTQSIADTRRAMVEKYNVDF
jgi:hypothetical protein